MVTDLPLRTKEVAMADPLALFDLLPARPAAKTACPTRQDTPLHFHDYDHLKTRPEDSPKLKVHYYPGSKGIGAAVGPCRCRLWESLA
jgi:hypothetical protein